jgi:hypothetical protein
MRPVLLDTCATIGLINGDPMAPASLEAIAAATARELGHVIVTRGAALLAFASARHVDILACQTVRSLLLLFFKTEESSFSEEKEAKRLCALIGCVGRQVRLL